MSQPTNTTHECFLCCLPATAQVRWYDFGDEDTEEGWRIDWVCGSCGDYLGYELAYEVVENPAE